MKEKPQQIAVMVYQEHRDFLDRHFSENRYRSQFFRMLLESAELLTLRGYSIEEVATFAAMVPASVDEGRKHHRIIGALQDVAKKYDSIEDLASDLDEVSKALASR